jgi:hypothetical protein
MVSSRPVHARRRGASVDSFSKPKQDVPVVPAKAGTQGRRGATPLLAALLLAAVAPAHAVDREKGANELIPGAPVFFDIRPLTLPVIEGNRIRRQIGILLTIELNEGHLKREAQERERELTSAFITELSRMYDWRAEADRVADERLIKTRLHAAADRILGSGVVRDVLIRQLVEQDR